MTRTRRVLTVTGVLLLAAATFTCASCSSARYVLRAGMAEARILAARQPIDEVVASPATPEETRRKLELVLTARTFAAHSLELDAGDSYTTFTQLDTDTLALVLSAAEKDRFRFVTWWFPIVGSVPYKGYFELDDALEAQRELEDDGYDTYLRPTGAFSTLGWFNDPLLSTLLRYDDVALASTVIHELTHNTVYVPGQAGFNESFANFVGDRGAVELFCGMEGEEGARCRHARARWADNLRFGAFLSELIAGLDSLYQREALSRAQKIERREDIIAEARERWRREVEPELETNRFRGFDRTDINNATLMARRLYYDRLGLFERVYQERGDLRAAIHEIVQAAEDEADDPWVALERLARPAVAPLPPS